MKKFHIELLPNIPNEGTSSIRIIVNDDEKPLIKSIKLYHVAYGSSLCLHIELKLSEEVSQESKELLRKHNVSSAHPFEYIYQLGKGKNKGLVTLIDLIQEIDPLPLSAIVQTITEIDLSEALKHLKILELADSGNIDEAITLVKGDNIILTKLINHLSEKDNIEYYLKVLSVIPKDHPEFKSANEILHNNLQSKEVPSDANERLGLLEKKFTYAFNAGLQQEATQYFHELSGHKDLKPTNSFEVEMSKFLLSIASESRKTNAELSELRAYKAKVEADKKANLSMWKNSAAVSALDIPPSDAPRPH